MRELLIIPNPILRQKCEPADAFHDDVHKLIQDMKEYMYAHRADEKVSPISLAAPQFGEPLCVIIFYSNPSYRELGGIDHLINPELVYAKDFVSMRETCLSVPEKAYIIKRAKKVKVRGYTLSGYPRTYKARDLVAQMFQHELNHLDGVLIDEIGELDVRSHG